MLQRSFRYFRFGYICHSPFGGVCDGRSTSESFGHLDNGCDGLSQPGRPGRSIMVRQGPEGRQGGVPCLWSGTTACPHSEVITRKDGGRSSSVVVVRVDLHAAACSREFVHRAPRRSPTALVLGGSHIARELTSQFKPSRQTR